MRTAITIITAVGETNVRKYGYKAAAFAFALACLSITMEQECYAGTINANEAELMGIIRGTFVYEGVSYVGDPSYINEAYYYFLRDDIEVTDSQKASAIKEMFSRIPEGISEGYLIPVGGKPAGVDTETSQASAGADSKEETSAEAPVESKAETSVSAEKLTSASQESQSAKPSSASTAETVPIYEEETAAVETQEADEIVSGDTVFYPAWSVKEKETEAPVLDFEALPVKKLEEYQNHQNSEKSETLETEMFSDSEKEELQEASETFQQLSAGFFTVTDWSAGMMGLGMLASLGVCFRLRLFHHKNHKKGKNEKWGK